MLNAECAWLRGLMINFVSPPNLLFPKSTWTCAFVCMLLVLKSVSIINALRHSACYYFEVTIHIHTSMNLTMCTYSYLHESNYVYIIGVLDSIAANPHIHADHDNAALPASLVVFQGTVLLSRTLTVLLVYAHFGTNLENKNKNNICPSALQPC